MSKREKHNSYVFILNSSKGCAFQGCFFKETNWEQKRAGITLSEISQSRKDKYCMNVLICGAWRSQIYRDKVEGGRQGLEGRGYNGELLLNGC